MKAICINPAIIEKVWPRVSHLIRNAMKRGGLGSFIIVEAEVLSGRYFLWVAIDGDEILGAWVTCLESTEWDKACVIVACGGHKLEKWISCIETVEAYAKAEQCNYVRIYGRKGWLGMLPAYRSKRVVIERAL